MSYTTQDVQVEFESVVDEVLRTRDIEGAYLIRDQFAREGDDEMASYWHNLARQWDREDWAYDNARDNTL